MVNMIITISLCNCIIKKEKIGLGKIYIKVCTVVELYQNFTLKIFTKIYQGFYTPMRSKM